ncbi:putative LMBR1-like membrane protein [Leishmania utingensis]|uniref:LMBR1-like membrane protein n=1 Tax=Leishmania utingensis TaxID=653362 RepID=A0AAW3B562_9TRYP
MFVVDWIAAGVVAILVLFLAVYIVFRYSAEEEDGDAWLPRVLVIVTLCVACYVVLLLPLEVALTGDRPSLDFSWAWKGMLVSAYSLLFVGGPFTFVFYESWSPTQNSVWTQVRLSLAVVVGVNVAFAAAFGALWLWGVHHDPKDDILTRVPPFVYFVVTISSFGWCFFFIFAGVGLAAVPLRAVAAFVNRPHPIKKAEYELARVKLRMEVQSLLDAGRRLDAQVGTGRPNHKQRQQMLLFRRSVRDVERQSERNEAAYHLSGAYILRCYMEAALGVVNGVVTVLWILHIFLSSTLNVFPLMDRMVCFLNGLLPMLATLIYAYCAMYLMWCTIVGCRSVSRRMLILPVYPLRVRGTMLNALLFNSLLLLCSAFAVLHLCAVSFSTYAASTFMHNVFVVTLPQMFGAKYVSQGLQYALLAVFVLSVPWLTVFPRRMTDAVSDEDEYQDDGLV